MPPSRLTLRVPGKLLIAGEYAVLEPHQPAVVTAVDRFMTATVTMARENRVTLPALGLRDVGWTAGADGVTFDQDDPRLKFVGEALGAAIAHVRDQFLLPLPFHLTLESELDGADGRKFGLGSSAAAVVATVAATLVLLRDDDTGAPEPETIFKLAAIAHLRAQGSGSGADVAASTFGGWLRYSSFQPEWLGERLRTMPLERLLREPWPFFSVERLSPLPRDLRLCVGWTGQPASTAALVQQVRMLRERDPAAYGAFLAESQTAVEHLVAGLTSANRGRALAALERNRRALATLGERAGVVIETPALAALHHWAEVCGGGGKPSGAGGGDCGVALIFGDDKLEGLQAAWRKAGLEPLPLGVSDAGVTVTRLEW
ncbi:MAG: phosphomevalonate kinase [Cyanobacteria bacterium RYN_339]|nr:phosphomevalonate kinase [Cyanobacteria bacterium RYN_339]